MGIDVGIAQVASQPERFDVIALFVQPVAEERVIGHPMMSIVDDVSSVGAIFATVRW